LASEPANKTQPKDLPKEDSELPMCELPKKHKASAMQHTTPQQDLPLCREHQPEVPTAKPSPAESQVPNLAVTIEQNKREQQLVEREH